MTTPKIAVLPEDTAPHLVEAVRDGGGEVVPVADAEAIVWTDPKRTGDLREILDARTDIRWVQLPWAGIEPFVDILDDDRMWTCGKGVYAEPVAEHALALTLATLRPLGAYANATTWTGPAGRNLLGATVTILGGGEITTSYVRMLGPFGCTVRVVRRHAEAMEGVDEVVSSDDDWHRLLEDTDVLMLALALTEETEGIVDAAVLDRLPDHAIIVNVARGQHIDTAALVAALEEGRLGGAGLDVTEPEPLPDGHPLWHRDDVIITPHTANTPDMGKPLLARRVRENVARFAAGEELLGPVHVNLGY